MMMALVGRIIGSALLLQASSVVAPPPVAIVATLQGTAWVRPNKGDQRLLRLYDWVTPAAVIEVAPAGRLVLIMIDGRRYALGGGARATLSSTSLTATRGEVTEESAMPRLVSLAAIAGKPPRAAAAVRVRGRGIARLTPCQGVLTLRDETVLQFEPVEGAPRYNVEVRTIDDRLVFARSIERPPLAIPAGVLAAGADYLWTVRTEAMDSPAVSEARFTTLENGADAERRAFAAALAPAAIGLLGALDAHVGLLHEAIAELTAAAQLAPNDVHAQSAAMGVRTRLASLCP
jgi:hypothetical protein